MVSLASIQADFASDRTFTYQCLENLNLYDSPALKDLATQAVAGRQLRILSPLPDASADPTRSAVSVVLCEDDYPGWVAVEDLDLLAVADVPYRAIALSADDIRACLPQVIAFVRQAMARPNHYLWGGTVGPNYDCSGLVQTAFASAGIWLPRDAYQQEAFVSSPATWCFSAAPTAAPMSASTWAMGSIFIVPAKTRGATASALMSCRNWAMPSAAPTSASFVGPAALSPAT